ncbi:hypothetical protein [Mycetohabitans rhizoxinica]|uniref:Shikimate kinase n=1 Tax=Mycetohabitans rhizoxinica TaxID=412963 RepID=A0ABZ2Q027_9BURK
MFSQGAFEMLSSNCFRLVLIGPRGAGKSSVADVVAHRCGLPLYKLDAHCFELYKADDRSAKAARDVGEFSAPQLLARIFSRFADDLAEDWLAYQESLHLVAVKLALEKAVAPILDRGSEHCSYITSDNQGCLVRLLWLHPVLCLWPRRDLSRGAALLPGRNCRSLAFNKAALHLHRGREIAKHVIDVEKKGINDIANEAIA